jgi:Uma2 family endonuclease
VRTPRLCHGDYFAVEREHDRRYEYTDGEIFAITGGSEAHALIAANGLATLAAALRNQACRVYGADMKLYIAAHDKFC